MVFLDWKVALVLGGLRTHCRGRCSGGHAICPGWWPSCSAGSLLPLAHPGVLPIITRALTYAAMLLFFRCNETGFGGNSSFTDFKRIPRLRHPRPGCG